MATNQLQTIGNFSPEDLQVMQQTIAKGTTPAQFNLFIRTAAASGLNPFLNHIYCIVYGQGNNATMSIQVSVEGIVFLAKRVEGYQGIDTQLVHENDEFEAYMNDQREWVIGEHKIKFPRGKVIAGYSIAYREGFRPYTVFMDVDEVQHNLSGNNSSLWKKYFNDMFKKHMTKRAAKGQFGIEIAEDDVPATGVIPEYESPQRRDITTEVDEATEKHQEEQPETDQQHEEDDEAAKLKKAKAEMRTKLKELGITGKEEIASYIQDRCQMKGPTPTLAEMTGLLKVMDLEIEQQTDDDDLLGPVPPGE